MITPTVRKPELSILYATSHLVLIYISTKYHQNIPKGIQLQSRQEVLHRRQCQQDLSQKQYERTRNLFQIKQRGVTPTVRKPELSIWYTTRHLVLIYQVSSKYSKGYSSYRADKKFYADAKANTIRPKNNMSPPLLFGNGGHKDYVVKAEL